jgi:DNA-binding transcriptional LysR family regulator
LPRWRGACSNLDEALESLTNLKELRRGLVRLAAPETLSCTLLPELIAAYNGNHPGVDVRFDDVPIQEVLAGLQNGSTDIGFGPAGVVPDQSVEAHVIGADPLSVALRGDDPLAKAKSVSWKDLRERPVLNYMPNIAINVLSHVPPRHHPKELVPVHRVNTALSMLRVRQGAVICPSMAEPLVRGFGLKFLPLTQPTVKWKIAMFVRNSASLSPAVESFRAFTLDFSPKWANVGIERRRAGETRRRV